MKTGRAAYLLYYVPWHWRPLDVVFEVVDVFAGGNIAVEIGRTFTTDEDGNERETGKYMSLFEKRDGKYICIRDAYNANQPEEGEEGDNE